MAVIRKEAAPRRKPTVVASAPALPAPDAKAAESPAEGGWRDRLRHRAIGVRRTMCGWRDAAIPFNAIDPSLAGEAQIGPLLVALAEEGFSADAAREAIQLIDRFTLGWAIAEQTSDGEDTPDLFARQLDVVLDGIQAANNFDARRLPTDPQWLLQSRLWTLVRSARETADIAYTRQMQLSELERRILFMLNAHQSMTLAEIATSSGADKAQVSRGAKRLAELALVERAGVRAPLRLSGKGRDITAEMLRLAEQRNRELTVGVSDEQLVNLFAMLEKLIGRAVLLYEQERKLAAGQGESGVEEDTIPPGGPVSGLVLVDRSRILPPLVTLSTYIMRSGGLSYKRLLGLSRFEAWVLSEIAGDPPMDWSRLVEVLGRDESQAARTLRHLVERGLIERSGKPGRRHGTFSPTSEGWRIFGMMRHVSERRNVFLLQDLSAAQLRDFLETFETIVSNGEAQLGRARALERLQA